MRTPKIVGSLTLITLLGCSGTVPSASGTGGQGGSGVAGATATTGGTHTVGGARATGGSVAGGSSSVGGAKATGGASTAGGTTASGGTNETGGSSAKGGTTGTGGTSAVGGTKATGGSSSVGGGSSAGGASTGGTRGGNLYPERGSVGWKAENCPGGIKLVNSPATAPSGTTWNTQNNYLDARGDASLNCVHIKGGLYISGGGAFTLTDSIVEGGATWFIVTRAESSDGPLLISNSTLRWQDGSSVNPRLSNGAGVIQSSGNQSGSQIIGNDISGNPDGIQLSGDDWVVRGNWIHNLARVGEPPNNTHNDGMQVYGGTNIVIEGNRIELDGFDGVHQNGALFFQVDSLSGVKIAGNFLEGGGFILRIEKNVLGAIVRDNVFGPPDRSVASWPGYVLLTGDPGIAEWSNNCRGDMSGMKLLPCQEVTP